MDQKRRSAVRMIVGRIGLVLQLCGFAVLACLTPMMVVGFLGGMEGFWDLLPPCVGSCAVLLICGGALQVHGEPEGPRRWLGHPLHASDPDVSGVRRRLPGGDNEDFDSGLGRKE